MRDNEFFCFGCGQTFTALIDTLEAQRQHQEACRRAREVLLPAPTASPEPISFEDEEA